MHFLTIVSSYKANEPGSLNRKALEEIIVSTTVLGKYGFFYQKGGQWYHIRWYLDSFLSDYLALCQMAKHGNQNSDYPCVHCSVRRELYNIFFNGFLPTTWPQIFDCGVMKTVQSSTLFLNKNSLFRLQSVVGCLFTGDKMRDLNRIKR